MNSKKTQTAGISFFEKYLTLWVALCMAIGILISVYLPGIPSFLNQFTYAENLYSHRNLNMAYDLSYDDESGFQKHYRSRQKSKGSFCYLGHKLAHQTFYHVCHRFFLFLYSI